MITLKSEVAKRLLNYFFLNPHENLYVNELTRKIDVDKRNLVKKLKEFEKEGIFKSRMRGNLKFYSINKDYSLYQEYKKIIFKTVGIEGQLRKILKEVSGIETVYIYGSYAKDKMDAHSDIDLLVVGKHKIVVLQKSLNKLQKELDREINVVNMAGEEFKKKEKTKDPFICGVLEDKHIKIIQ